MERPLPCHVGLLPFLLLGACAAPDSDRTPGPAGASDAVAERSGSSIELLRRAVEAYQAGDEARARDLTRQAIAAFNAEPALVNPGRMALLTDLSQISDRLTMSGTALELWNRRTRIFRELHRTFRGSLPAAYRYVENRPTTDFQQEFDEERFRVVVPGQPVLHEEDLVGGGATGADDPIVSADEDVAAEASSTSEDEESTAREEPDLEDRLRMLLALRKLAEAKSLLQGLLGELEAQGQGDGEAAVEAHRVLGEIAKAEGDFETAREHEEIVVEARKGSGDPSDPAYRSALSSLLGTLAALGDHEGLRRCVTDAGTETTGITGLLAAGAFANTAEAREGIRRTIDSGDRDDPGRTWQMVHLAGLCRAAGEDEEAEDLYMQAGEQLGNGDPDLDLCVLEGLARGAGDWDPEAERQALLERGLQFLLQSRPEDHPTIQAVRQGVARGRLAGGDARGALAIQRAAFDTLARTLPPDHPDRIESGILLTEILEALGETEQGVGLLEASVGGTSRTVTPEIDALLARADEARGRCELEEALQLRQQALELQEPLLEPHHPAREEALRDIAALLRVLGRADEARAVEQRAALEHPDPTETAARLARAREAAWRSAAPDGYPPRVTLDGSAAPDADGLRAVIAEIEDASGILALHIVQDGVARTLPAGSGAWHLDEDGRHARLDLPVALAEGRLSSVVSVAAENPRHVRSEFATVVVEAPPTESTSEEAR